jgi:hypothetical protein
LHFHLLLKLLMSQSSMHGSKDRRGGKTGRNCKNSYDNNSLDVRQENRRRGRRPAGCEIDGRIARTELSMDQLRAQGNAPPASNPT